MAELPEDDPRVGEALQLLMRRVSKFVGYPLNESTVLAIRSVIEQTRNEFKRDYQHELSPLVPLILPTSWFIAWFRQDLDSEQVRIKVLNLLRELTINRLPIGTQELAMAMKLAWPLYEPPIEDFINAYQVRLLQ